ncbi:cwf18 pre-mRna splicing factor protein [Cardiosporidium cionae]|uniref:Cwf18 pre-mRna splicing factor protein n=1 Tax=Cardiosporidium cionae TaxID=476202 RepID=A0ABQ7J6W4_9APIC|nr:cwf18 pre-mRna splicing factor protein [Cardiosporidium cionae]|eukprot:KAF8819711.1 cwf18 pre-mRna splicing factor protein [Cardiosporidium cionae]
MILCNERDASVGSSLRFRNYIPRDTSLRKFCNPKPLVKELEEQIDLYTQQTLNDSVNQDILSQITPKRPNWDLKRDVEKKLQVLSNRTDRSILNLLRIQLNHELLNPEESCSLSMKDTTDSRTNENEATLEDWNVRQSVLNAMTEMEKLDNLDTDECS